MVKSITTNQCNMIQFLTKFLNNVNVMIDTMIDMIENVDGLIKFMSFCPFKQVGNFLPLVEWRNTRSTRVIISNLQTLKKTTLHQYQNIL